MKTNQCNRGLIDQFFRNEQAGASVELIKHLETCAACRRYFDSQAAAPDLWLEAQQMLKASEFDLAGSDEFSGGGQRVCKTTHSLSIQTVLDSLVPSEHPDRLGRLGTHEVSGVIGVGGMGVVLKAVDPALDRVVAIKVMAPHLAHSATARRRFAREAKAAAAVLHPNVIPIHFVSSDDEVSYLVMAYIRGGSLQKRLEHEGPMGTVEIVRVGSQIAAGLAAAHEQGLVHRDIKPENILLEESVERVTITDFGLARAVDDASLTQIGAIAGTPQYMSPEQARGETLDQLSDLFSLGSVMYALCTGRAPFRASSSHGVMRKIIDEQPNDIRDLNPEIPDWLCAIIGKLMAKDKDDRFRSAAEVQQLLESCLGHIQQPTVTSLPKIPSLLQQKKTYSVQKTILGACVMLTVIASLLFALGILPNAFVEPNGGQSNPRTERVQDDTGSRVGANTRAAGHRLPDGLPPLIGSAVVNDLEGDRSEWTIALTLPSSTWSSIKDEMPDLRWPQIVQTLTEASTHEGTMTLPIDDSSQPMHCRIVDTTGKELSPDQVRDQLKTRTPVLVSVTGEMPHACYLHLPTSASLMVLLGPGHKPIASDTPLQSVKPTIEPEMDLTDWTEEKSQQYFFELMQNSQTFTIKENQEASKYLQGLWRLDKRAHIGGGHYVHADQGDDVAVVFTDQWLVVRLGKDKDIRDAVVGRYERINLDENGHIRVEGEDSLSYNHFQPLDENHMAIRAYDFIAVVKRVACVTPESAKTGSEKDAVEQEEKEVVEAAKAHLRALLTTDRQVLSNSYSAKVRMLRNTRDMDREKAIDAGVKQFAGGGDVPAAVVDQLLDRMTFESLDVVEGEFVTPPSESIATEDGRLRFAIAKGDRVVKISQGRSDWFLQFRKSNNDWTVVAEYTD